jgi:hypothetical protein
LDEARHYNFIAEDVAFSLNRLPAMGAGFSPPFKSIRRNNQVHAGPCVYSSRYTTVQALSIAAMGA